jgi:dTMP kinase
VITLVAYQARAPLETIFWAAVVGTGVGIIVAASFSALVASMFAVVFVGACAGTGYVSGFTLLQRNSADEVRGRTFAALYTLIRMCLLLSLTVTPLLASAFGELSAWLFDGSALEIGGQTIVLPGVRLALWLGGTIALVAGLVARRELIAAHRTEERVAESVGDQAA